MKTWEELYLERLANRGNPQMQEQLAPQEHRAWAREKVQENPFNALAYGILPLGYQASKILGLGEKDDMTTPASLNQLIESYKGVGDGLYGNFQALNNKLAGLLR